ncbi:glycosyltransferase [Calothrix sp. NIES-2100]|uniref:glycosyltransferase family 2 protein n=1 Tax=Calothrix sp. NIES-2100 TaxID=1954172 RepID=UPI000B60351E|nr:glycosyltransferase [Calothrix sp. NIES-2100]
MKDQITLTASLVLYNNNSDMIEDAVKSLLNTNIKFKLCVIDNSPSPVLKNLFHNLNHVDYHYNDGNNLGFGKAHNLALKLLPSADYHLVLNPDVFFEINVIPELIKHLDYNQDIGLISPKIYYPSGEIQYLCKNYPSFFLLFVRRFIPQTFQFFIKNYLERYEMRETGYEKVMDVTYLSGCFMLFRRKYLDEIGYFDENIFMYLEDADITLRMAKKYRTVFYPNVHIFHHWAKGSYKSLKLTLINIQSAFYFFNKHGWKLF